MESLVSCLVIVFTGLLLLSRTLLAQAVGVKSNETDRVALLQIRSQISDDPDQILSSWNGTVDFCHWPGITCSSRHHRVTNLELPGSRFKGSLSPYVGNLSFLRIINMDNNGFTGEIPPGIGNLRRLTMLSLENNSFSGRLPQNISGCAKLRDIALRNNKLVGEIPREFASLSELRFFDFSGNNFSGKFPDFFGNFSSLEVIGGVYNNFRGTIPASLGQLQNLQTVYLGYNLFTGVIPASIFNITSLAEIDLVSNHLEGGLPHDMGINLPNLSFTGFGDNHLTGLIPPSIGNATKIEMLQIPRNNFTGSVPDLSNLNRLQWVVITRNQLGSGKSGDLNFLYSLNSSKLQVLQFNINNFGGTLPQSIGNLSSSLDTLYFDSTRLSGSIPSSIGNLRNLERLIIGWNQMTGRLPGEIGSLSKLRILGAPLCQFSGEIPSSLGNLTMLMILSLAGNEFRGSIPASLGKCQNLFALDLSGNNLSGTIPSEVLRIPSLVVVLDLSYNRLTGALPDEIGGLTKMASLYVQENRLSGQVPNALGGCTSLIELYMQNNQFSGNIASFLAPLRGLQYLDLSLNNFSGEIPKFLGDFQLSVLNLSFNHFEGEVPNRGGFLNVTGISVMGNDMLCGGIPLLNLSSYPIPQSKQRRKIMSKVIIKTVSGIVVLFVILLLFARYIVMKRYKRRNIKPQAGLVPTGTFPQISYEDILRATEGFSQNNLIGAGSFGSVYKGILESGVSVVAIKVLDLQNRAASKSFMAECEALRNIRHRNLVMIFTACSTIDFQGNEFKALVYEYMENGSLEDWLHSKFQERESQKLSLMHRLQIAVDIVCALEYLHHESETPIVHCDLKPSNVLLDADMTAHVSDFGLVRILSTDDVIVQASSLGVRGTIGYSPPEYGIRSEVSRNGDTYSYGVLLLEMFTGKRLTDDIFQDNWNLRCYCEAALPERAAEIADPSLFSNEFGEGTITCAPRRVTECLVKVFEVGIGCSQESPGERTDIRVAAAKLRSIKNALAC